MKWVIAPHSRAEIHSFTGLNLSGLRTVAEIFPAGGLQGQEIDGSTMRSAVVGGLPGTRVVFCTTISDDWLERPWRAFVIEDKRGFRAKGGMTGVRVPDIDMVNGPTDRRTDPDFEQSFDFAETLEAGKGWTFGNPGKIQGNVRCIRIDRVPDPE